jgi:hypothetical protein
MSKATRTVEERLDSFAEAWRPEAGDKLIGTVVDLDERDSDFGDEPYPIVTVLTDTGDERAFHGFHTVARNELAKQRPKVGERIGIAYHGLSDKGYERYRIIVERDETPSLDWDRYAEERPEFGSDAA